jgi:hypothetical protein
VAPPALSRLVRSLLPSLLLLLLPAAAGAGPPLPPAADGIGVVTRSKGDATVSRGGKAFRAEAGTRLQAGDILATGRDGSMGVILRDDSTLSLGPDSTLAVEKFLFSPADGKYGLLARLSRGTMAYLSGLIGKLAPEKARFETPVASIGIRGTRFAVKADAVPGR